MELDFDKEIDILLRKAGAEPSVLVGDTAKLHLDADELSSFAENALPEKARQSYMLHLADCGGCRKILSNLILLNSEAEPAAPSVLPAVAGGENVPWFRKLFLFPNLAYVMGSLVLVFSGFLGYLVLQNSMGDLNSEVSLFETSQSRTSGPSFNEEPDYANSNANMAANYSANTMAEVSDSTNMAVNKPNSPLFSTNAAISNSTISRKKDLSTDGAQATTGAPPPQPKARSFAESDQKTLAKSEVETDVQIVEPPGQAQKQKVMRAISPPATGAASRPVPKNDSRVNDGAELRVRKSASSGTGILSGGKRVGGRTFELKQDVWYDSAYHGQATTNVRRGTNEYRKLDSGLRAIAKSLAGTLVVVWKDRAYRIQ